MKKFFSKNWDAILLLLCFILSGLLSVCLGQDCNWDLRNYHFYNAYAFLHNRFLYDIAPAQIQTFINPVLDIPSYFLIVNFPPLLTGFLIGGLQGLNLWLVYEIAYASLASVSESSRRLLSLAAAITGYLGVANISEIGTVFGDNLTSLFVLGALLLIISSLQRNTDRDIYLPKRDIIGAGILLGLGTGLKLTNAVYDIGVLLALSLSCPSWRKKAKTFLWLGFGSGIGFMATGGYWMVRMWQNFDNPLFPFFNGIFKSKYYKFVNVSDHRFLPRNILQELFYPFFFVKEQHLVSELPFRDFRLAICYTLVVLFVLIKCYDVVKRKYQNEGWLDHGKRPDSRKIIQNFMLFFFIFSYVLWQTTFSIYRYVVPLELLSPILVIITITYIFPSKQVLIRSSLVVFALMIFTVHFLSWGRLPWRGSFFGVEVPIVENLEHSTVIMIGGSPFSYVIPYFPAGTRFVSVNNNFIEPTQHHLLAAKIRAILERENMPLYLICRKKQTERSDVNDVLSYYGLSYDQQSCKRIRSRADKDFLLCKVIKESSKT